ncbi:MAG: ATPases with chaperone activity, ATP-binding subunit [Parcubacteria group bacterium GW2011_GWA2_42_28]|nr:MAG: ATPases with chaperone activity, ATP-binding subunit [Parcubacteria group bacterium GW2011_GWA2_42_28]KKT53896.1 MAG: ATPases with chaperone activity, ATP-binding subunit [Parcubacteria group bacterium GW2011_GWC2_44_22]
MTNSLINYIILPLPKHDTLSLNQKIINLVANQLIAKNIIAPLYHMFNSYDKFTPNFKKVIQHAAWLCLNDLKKIITPRHLLAGLLSITESQAYNLLKKTSNAPSFTNPPAAFEESIAKFTTINPNLQYDEVFSLSMDKDSIGILEKAADIAVQYKSNFIGTQHLLAAMLELQSPPLLEKINQTKIDQTLLREKLTTVLQTIQPTPSAGEQSALPSSLPATAPYAEIKTSPLKSKNVAGKTRKFSREIMPPTPALDYFTVDLTSTAKQASLHPIIGRDQEIERLIHILSRQHKNNPLLLGDPGVGKTAIVEGLAKKIHDGQVPDILVTKKILALDLNSVVAGTIYRGEFENRLKQIIEEVKTQDDVILFIDEIHNLIGAGSASGSLDAANILKPYLARGEVSCIGATTFQEYKAHIESDAALERRFQTITVEEPSPAETINILKGVRSSWENYHRVTITDEAINEAVNLSGRFMPNRYYPDKAIDLIDEAASRAKVKNMKDIYVKQIKQVKGDLKELTNRKDLAIKEENFSLALTFKEKEEKMLQGLFQLKKKQERGQQKKVAIINKEDIAQVVTEIIKIPFLEMINVDRSKLLNLENLLGQRVLGQAEVLKEIAKTLRRAEAGLSHPNRPLASFIFLGPSGVGKTETAKVIAEDVFGDKNALIRINMSEFQESFNATKLIGAPAGYIGYKDGNQLADKVRSKPYCVVLFDEMEKAHPDVFNLLLQVLEDGYMQDSSGKIINFKNAIIIFTSNIGLERFNRAQGLGFSAAGTSQKDEIEHQFGNIKEHIMDELYSAFKVEFLNRIDKILFFQPLTQQTLTQIVELNVAELNQRLRERGISLQLSPAAKKWLAKNSFSPDEGARGVRRIIQEQVEEALVEKILQGQPGAWPEIKIGLKGKKIVLESAT